MKTPTAPNAEKMTTPDISGRCSRGRRLRLEDRGRQSFATFREVLQMYGAVAGGGVEALDVALFVDACLAKLKQLLCLCVAVDESRHLADTHDLARPTPHPLGLDDDVDRGPDLLLNRTRGEIRAGHQDHCLQAADGVLRAVGMDCAHRALVAGVHRLEHVHC